MSLIGYIVLYVALPYVFRMYNSGWFGQYAEESSRIAHLYQLTLYLYVISFFYTAISGEWSPALAILIVYGVGSLVDMNRPFVYEIYSTLTGATLILGAVEGYFVSQYIYPKLNIPYVSLQDIMMYTLLFGTPLLLMTLSRVFLRTTVWSIPTVISSYKESTSGMQLAFISSFLFIVVASFSSVLMYL